MIKGAFYAINKNKTPEAPKNIDQSYYYMNNKNPEYFINNNKNINYNTNYFFNQNKNSANYNQRQTNFDFLKKIFFILFCLLIAFLVYDFIIIYKNVKKDNNIERNRCIEEYKAGKCGEMTIDDGPIANDYCEEKSKCIHSHTVYFHVVLIKYIRSIILNCFRGSSLVNTLLISGTLVIIIKILY